MRAGVLLLIAATASAVVDTDSNSNSTSPTTMLLKAPDCALPCFIDGYNYGKCTMAWVANCVCTNVHLQARVSECVQRACEIPDQIATVHITQKLCRGYPKQEHRRYSKVLSIGLPSFTAATVFLRCVARKQVAKRLWWDDGTASIALGFLIVASGLGLASSSLGYGSHYWDIDPNNGKAILKIFYAQQMLYILVQPIESNWDRYIEGRCFNVTAIVYAGAACSILEDLFLIVLPIPELLKLQLSSKKRIALVFMFALGSFACIASMVRLQYLVSFADSFDSTYENVMTVIWSAVELNGSDIQSFSLRLNTFPLEGAPPFWALSYTWGPLDFDECSAQLTGSETRLHDVECDGQVVRVGETLYDYLDQVKKEMSSSFGARKHQTGPPAASPSYRLPLPAKAVNLWVDAMCIDQNSSQEKSHQVQMMGQIYEAARNVIVWLGKAQPNEDVCWVLRDFIPKIRRAARSSQTTALLQETGPELDHPQAIKALGKKLCDRWRNSYTDYFAFFLKKRWLTRGWVVQEAALPKPKNIVLQCGNEQFSWSRINQLSALILMFRWDEELNDRLSERLPDWKKRPGTIDRLWNPIQNSLPAFSGDKVIHRMADWQNHRWGTATDSEIRHAEVLHTFHRLRIYQFENPLDHIYGALGLIQRILGRRYELGVVPSYNIPVEHAYTQVVTWLLRHLPNLDILGLAGIAEGRRENLPSWVPDFSFHGAIHFTSLQRLRQLAKWGHYFDAFDASRTDLRSSHHVAQSEGNTSLKLEGLLIDKVGEARGLEQSSHGIITNVAWLLDFCNQQGSYEHTGEHFADVAVATLSADLKPTLGYGYDSRQWTLMRSIY
ncbi:heterokaryon incompatibility protein [Colletotrichum graminicola]|nr:heterokaryon incompatibility protein [Colletotrichum graminicola]